MQGEIGEAPTGWVKLRVILQHRLLTGLLIVSFAVGVSAAIVAPYYYSIPNDSPRGQIRFAHDIAIHLSVMKQFDNMLRSGAGYPRWLSDVNYGYGNAWPNFYQPGFYFLTSLVNCITRNWIDTLFVITALGLAASGLGCYVLARLFFGKLASAIAATVYALLPYHLLDVFWRGAMPEYLSFALLPLILYFFYRLGRQGRALDCAGLGVCYGLCLFIHVPIGYLFSYFLVFYALTWATAKRDWRIAGRIVLGMAIGALLSAIYWLPAVMEIKYATEKVTELFAYHKNYVTLLGSVSHYDHLLRETFFLQAIGFLVIVAAWSLLDRIAAADRNRAPAENDTRASSATGWIIMGLLSLFMNLPESYYLARLIPKIEIVVFPWRWLVFVSLFTSLLAAGVVQRAVNSLRPSARANWGYVVASMFTTAVLGLSVWFAVQAVLIGSLANPMTANDREFLSDSYCPKSAPPVGSLPQTERIVVGSRTGSSQIMQWAPLYRQAVITSDEPTTARFKTFNFPGWTARVDGSKTPISSDPVAAQMVEVPEGRHTIEIEFGSTPVRTLGAALSIAGVVALCVLTLAGRLSLGKYGWLLGKDAGTRQTRLEGFASSEPREAEAQIIHRRLSAAYRIKQIAKLSLFGIVLAAGVLSAVMLIKEMRIVDERKQARVQPTRSVVGVGLDARLSVGTSNEVTVAADDGALRELIDALSRGDDRNVEALLQSGRAFAVERDTKVRVLELAGGKAKIEILEGGYANKKGWVPEGWLK